jgi:hypothetical protein
MGVGSVLKDTVKESNASLMGNILQVTYNFNIISGCFFLNVTKITVSLHSFLPLAALRFLHINCSQIYESPSVADISL